MQRDKRKAPEQPQRQAMQRDKRESSEECSVTSVRRRARGTVLV
jgi:hypothetical protein